MALASFRYDIMSPADDFIQVGIRDTKTAAAKTQPAARQTTAAPERRSGPSDHDHSTGRSSVDTRPGAGGAIGTGATQAVKPASSESASTPARHAQDLVPQSKDEDMPHRLPHQVLLMLNKTDAHHAMYDALFVALYARDMSEAKYVQSSGASGCTWKLRKRTDQPHAFKLYLNAAADGKSAHTFVFDPLRKRWTRRQRADEMELPQFNPMLSPLVLEELCTHGWHDDKQQYVLTFPECAQLECVAATADADDDACLKALTTAPHKPGAPSLHACCTHLPQLDTDDAADGHARRPVVRSQCLDIGNGRPIIPLVSLALKEPINGARVLWLTATRSTHTGKPTFFTSLSIQKLMEHLQKS